MATGVETSKKKGELRELLTKRVQSLFNVCVPSWPCEREGEENKWQGPIYCQQLTKRVVCQFPSKNKWPVTMATKHVGKSPAGKSIEF